MYVTCKYLCPRRYSMLLYDDIGIIVLEVTRTWSMFVDREPY
jgi:hypothetical protein